MSAGNHTLQMGARKRSTLVEIIAFLIALIGVGLATNSALASAPDGGSRMIPDPLTLIRPSSSLAPQVLATCTISGVLNNIAPTGGTITVFMDDGTVNPRGIVTPVRRITLTAGGIIYGYCMNALDPSNDGAVHCLTPDPNNIRLTYLLTKYPPSLTSNTD